MEEMVADFMNDDERPEKVVKHCETCTYCSGELKHGVCECYNAESKKEFVYLSDSCPHYEG